MQLYVSPCNMPKYVSRIESITNDPEGSALCLLTFGHILAYYTDYPILFLLLLVILIFNQSKNPTITCNYLDIFMHKK